MKIDGKQIANKILKDLKLKVIKLQEKDISPKLAIILVGEDPASAAYVRQKELKAESVGIKTTTVHLSDKISQENLLETIQQFNNDDNIHGIIVQQPLPQNVNLNSITNAIDPKKDVDGFRPDSYFQMPIAMAVFRILEELRIKIKDLRNKNIVIVGKGETGGKPIINSLQKLKIKPFVIDSKTQNSLSLMKNADIIISAVGKSDVVKEKMIKNGVILISVGLHKGNDGKLYGDYNENEIKKAASFYTPTPGGVGPVNVACLLKNLIESACNFSC